MPTPIGHSLAGLSLFWAAMRNKAIEWKLLLTAIIAAILPDGDFIFGFFVGNPNKFHHQFTHSLVFVILAGTTLSLFIKGRSFKSYLSYAGLFSLMGMLHLFLDAVCVDTSAPYGFQLFWPFTKQYYIFPITPLLDVHRASESVTFFTSMLNWHNLKTVSLELLIFIPLVVLSYKWRKKTIKNH